MPGGDRRISAIKSKGVTWYNEGDLWSWLYISTALSNTGVGVTYHCKPA